MLDILLVLHLLAAVVFVGGGFTVTIMSRQALALLDAGPRLQVQMQMLQRLFFYGWHALPIMILTGWAMVFRAWGGFGALPWAVNAMQGLGILMLLLFAYTFFDPWKRLRRAIRPAPEMLNRVKNMVALNTILGLITVTIAAFSHVW